VVVHPRKDKAAKPMVGIKKFFKALFMNITLISLCTFSRSRRGNHRADAGRSSLDRIAPGNLEISGTLAL